MGLRAALMLAACLLAASISRADARSAPAESSSGRSLLQTIDCSRIPHW